MEVLTKFTIISCTNIWFPLQQNFDLTYLCVCQNEHHACDTDYSYRLYKQGTFFLYDFTTSNDNTQVCHILTVNKSSTVVRMA